MYGWMDDQLDKVWPHVYHSQQNISDILNHQLLFLSLDKFSEKLCIHRDDLLQI